MLWNAINDPLFGYFQDQSTWEFCSNRQKAILYGAPLWAACFLLPWFPWSPYEPGEQIDPLQYMPGMFRQSSLESRYPFTCLSNFNS